MGALRPQGGMGAVEDMIPVQRGRKTSAHLVLLWKWFFLG